MTPVEIYRYSLADEVRDRAPELTALAERIEALPDEDTRFDFLKRPESTRWGECLDMLTSDEFAREIERFLDDYDRARLAEGVTFGPDFTHRVLATPGGRAEIAGIVALSLSDGPADPSRN